MKKRKKLSILYLVKKIWKILLVILIIGAIGTGAYFLMKSLGIDSIEGVRQVVDNSVWGAVIFGLILIFQVIFLPAGTLAFTGSAVLLFESPLKAWLICWISLAIGSFIMFWLGRIFGIKILKWIVGSEKTEKYASYLGKAKFILPLILLVPVFPDDIICLAAGISNINPLYFMSVVFITRGIDNFCTVFVGASMLKSTVGIILLVIFVIAMIIASYFLTKHQEKIENFFLEKFTRKKRKPNKANQTEPVENLNPSSQSESEKKNENTEDPDSST